MASVQGMKSELDLFLAPITQTNVEQGKTVAYKPIASLQGDAPIEFHVPGGSEEYIDLPQTMMQVNVKVTKNGQPLDVADNVGPVNNFLQSIFSQVEIYLNQKLITPVANSYPYRCYIETLLNYGPSAKNSHLSAGLWVNDLAGQFDSLTANTGLVARKAWVALSSEVELYGSVFSDLFNINRYLLNQVEMKLKFVRSKSSFCLMGETNDYNVVITDMTLFVRKVKIAPKILLAHEVALSRGPAKYPFTRVETKILTLPSNVQNTTMDNIFLGPLPKRIILGFLKNKSYNGDIKLNPYNFQHFDLNHLSLYIDSDQFPSRPLTPNYEKKRYTMAYYTLFSGTGMHYLDDGNEISIDDYAKGNTLYAFDLTADHAANATTHLSPVRIGNLRMEVGFAKVLTETINCVVYAEFNSQLEIDKHRNPIIDYGS